MTDKFISPQTGPMQGGGTGGSPNDPGAQAGGVPMGGSDQQLENSMVKSFNETSKDEAKEQGYQPSGSGL